MNSERYRRSCSQTGLLCNQKSGSDFSNNFSFLFSILSKNPDLAVGIFLLLEVKQL